MKAKNRTHGHSAGDKISPTYHTWAGMVARCTNLKHKSFHCYGGRGITVCEQWRKFANFLTDMGEKPPNKSLDRRDNEAVYSPKNCFWASVTEQSRNKRNNHFLTLDGISRTLAEWAEVLNIHPATLSDRLQHGWSDERALRTPVRITKAARSRANCRT